MARVQLALNVPDIDEAVEFYTTLLGVGPHKRRPGYANFAADDPPLKLVLFESQGAERLNHLGIEVGDTDEVAAASERLRGAGLATDVREQELCCHAVQDKVWVDGPDGRWEVYTVLDDEPVEAEAPEVAGETVGASACCT